SAAGPGLVNCNGFQNPGLERFRAAIIGLPHRVPLIVSVAGESVDDYVRLVTRLGPLGDLVAVNISSPNPRLVYEWRRKPRALVVRPGTRDHRYRRRGLAGKSPPAAPRGRDRRRLLHRIHHAGPDSGARDPRAPPRRPLSPRPYLQKMLTPYPHFHSYPQ